MDIPEVTDLDCIFGGKAMKLLPDWDELTDIERSMRGPYCEAAQKLFFEGGQLADVGLKPKPGVDPVKLRRMIQACLCDFAPKHEHKIGGTGHLLAKYCDRIEEQGGNNGA